MLIKTRVSYSGESDYPGIVSISNTDPDAKLWGPHKSCLGQYSAMEGESSHGAPVYKHNDNAKRFFFVGKNKFWYCSYTHGPTAGGFFSASRKKGAWTRYTGPKSITYEGMSIEGFVPVFMNHSVFRIGWLPRRCFNLKLKSRCKVGGYIQIMPWSVFSDGWQK